MLPRWGCPEAPASPPSKTAKAKSWGAGPVVWGSTRLSPPAAQSFTRVTLSPLSAQAACQWAEVAPTLCPAEDMRDQRPGQVLNLQSRPLTLHPAPTATFPSWGTPREKGVGKPSTLQLPPVQPETRPARTPNLPLGTKPYGPCAGVRKATV